MFDLSRKRSDSMAGVVDLDMSSGADSIRSKTSTSNTASADKDSNGTILSDEANSTAEVDENVEVDASVASLDELLSPVPGEDSTPAHRGSLADSVIAAGDEDTRFSVVPLSGSLGNGSAFGGVGDSPGPSSQSKAVTTHSLRSSASTTSTPDANGLGKRSTIALPRRGSDASPRESGKASINGGTAAFVKRHKKAASSYTSGGGPRASMGNLPFLLQRLDLQRAQKAEAEAAGGATGLRSPRRASGSADGQQRLQEEFVRIHSGAQAQEDTEDADAEANIDWDFWGAVMADYQQFASENAEKLAKEIERGIPKSLRGMMWQLMSASKDTDLEATYVQLLKQSSSHEKAILRDLGRTFPHHDYFTDGQGIGQENLFNVLKAYSLYDPEVGYCQGLPFVVAILLLNMPDEEAFCLLVRLMYSYGLRGHFLPEMPGLQLRMYQFDRLVEELLPVLHVHFLRQGVKSSMFCSQWFLTMFSYRFPLNIVFRIYDNVLASGIESIFGFSVVLLQKNEEELLKLKFDDILTFLKNKLFDKYVVTDEEGTPVDDISHRDSLNDGSTGTYLVDEFVQDALSLKITPFMLDSYAHEHEELVRNREAHLVEVDNLRNTNRHLSNQVKTLEDSMAELNTEHCEVVKDLIMMRLRNEELESELVRYKLLYAEAMHQNEDAMSSHRLSKLSQRSFGK